MISIVSSLYHSENHVEEFCHRVVKVVHALMQEYEIILVNDGSPDNSLHIATQLTNSISNLRVINLSKNFGHHYALQIGLAYSKGDYIFLIDSDLEEEPELLSIFWHNIQADRGQTDVVYGLQGKRKGRLFEKVSGFIFYKLLAKFIYKNYQANTLTARLMTKRYVNAVLRYKEQNLDLWSIFSIVGYVQKPVVVNKLSKKSSTYSFKKKVEMATTTLCALSVRPLYFIFYVGCCIMTSLFFLMIWQWVDGKLFVNYAQVILFSIWFVFAAILIALGIVAIYLAKIWQQTQNRPNAIVKEVYENGQSRGD